MVSQLNSRFFKLVHNHSLLYNACWEDPRIDRQLLELDQSSKVVMLTSAGCNALDYLLDSPAEIHTVDVNPYQNALLELKLALIRQRDFSELFAMFGEASYKNACEVIDSVADCLGESANQFWRRKHYYFNPPRNRGSFYYCGSAGKVAWFFGQYFLRVRPKLRSGVERLLNAQSLAEQRRIVDEIEEFFWDPFTSWVVKQPMFMAFLGVPKAQMQLVYRTFDNDMRKYIWHKFKHVSTEVPIQDNYFWRVYLTGSYTPECCPNYLKLENFEPLRQNASKIQLYTTTLTEFLRTHPGEYTHFVLLDHQDWLAWHDPAALAEEWQLILQNSQPGTKILLRSAGSNIDFLPQEATEALRFYPQETELLHQQDRVGTYASLHFAEVL